MFLHSSEENFAKACTIKKKEDKSLRGTDGTGRMQASTHAQQFCGHSEASLGPAGFTEQPFKGTAVFIDKEQKQLLNWETINPRTYKQTHTVTVVQGRGEGLRTIPR